MPRQIGKTIGGVSILDWYIYLAAKKLSVGMFCQGSMLQWDNVKRLKEIRDALPKYLIYPSVADSNNKEGVTYAELGTQLQTFIAQMDKQAADRLGRGNSLAVEMWDEIAYFVNNDLSWSSATAAMNSAAPAARETGLPAAIIITTTAGDMDDKWGNFAYKMVCDALRFTEALYDVEDRAHLMDILRTNSKNNIVYMEYDHKQLGKSDEWFEEVTRGKDPKVIEKDYRNKWIHGSDNSLFDKVMLDRITGSSKEPVTTTWMESLVINWYVHPDEIMKNAELRNRPYIIGCDTSDNVGRDFTSVVMLDPYSLKPVATIRANCTNFMFIARCIVKLLIDFPRSIIIPERNKNGAVLVDYIILEIRNFDGEFEEVFSKLYEPGEMFNTSEQRYIFPVQDVLVNGTPDSKVDIVILPEGYTAAEMTQFQQDCQNLVNVFSEHEPFASHINDFNFRAVLAPSEESGVDFPGDYIWARTILNAHFYTFYIDRYCTTRDYFSVKDVAANAPYDQIYILVNSNIYGGGGFYNFYSMSTSGNMSSSSVIVHEFGHAFAGLGDEYVESSNPLGQLYNMNVEPWEANLTTLVDFDSKWADLVASSTPIPTPDNYQYGNVVGAYEGVCPNPATDFIDIFVQQADAPAEILDMNGRTLKTVHLNNKANRVMISDLPRGVYLVHVNGETRKFVKQ